jgi:hypothetical protein
MIYKDSYMIRTDRMVYHDDDVVDKDDDDDDEYRLPVLIWWTVQPVHRTSAVFRRGRRLFFVSLV